MPEPAPYFTWADAAFVAKGEKALKALLAPSTDTAEEHPVFDEHYETTVSIAEAEFQRGGFKVPLPTPLADAALRNAMIGVFLGVATAGNSDREPWIDSLEGSGRKWLKRIGDGSLPVKGGTLDDGGVATQGSAASIGFNNSYQGVFSLDDDESPFTDMNIGRSRRRG